MPETVVTTLREQVADYTTASGPASGSGPNLLDRLRQAMRACHYSRRSRAIYLLTDGYGIRTIQELLGHSDVSTTVIYTHVLSKGGHGVRSPVDGL